MGDRLQVVVGVIIREDGRMLLVQRPEGKDFAFCWECPGGKVEPGETFVEALRRELAEEVGLGPAAIALEPFESFSFDPPTVGRACDLHYFAVIPPADWRPRDLEGMGYGWFTEDEGARLRLAAGNQRLRHLRRGARPQCAEADSNGTRCELGEGHEGQHAAPKALERFLRGR